MRDGGAYGAIFLFRSEPRPFTADQIALVETFAPAGGDRHRQRAAVQRDARGARQADGDQRGAARDRELAGRREADALRGRRARAAPVRGGAVDDRHGRRRRAALRRAVRQHADAAGRRQHAADARVGGRPRGPRPHRDAPRGSRRGARSRVSHGTRAAAPLRAPGDARRAADARAERDRRDRAVADGTEAVQRPAGRARQDLRRPGGHRDRERPPVQRDARGAGAAAGLRRGALGDLELDRGHGPGVREDPRELRAAVRRASVGADQPRRRRRPRPSRGLPRARPRGDRDDLSRSRWTRRRRRASRCWTAESSTSPTSTAEPDVPPLARRGLGGDGRAARRSARR